MAAPEIDIKYVAHLARLALTPEEEQKIGAQLGHVLGYIEKLKEVDVSNVEPTAHAFPLVNVTRPDEIRPSLSNEEALRNAPATANGVHGSQNCRVVAASPIRVERTAIPPKCNRKSTLPWQNIT
jgi:aspartyl-tRNA(Asn)/glutamyl-tRNA(Gln) amidotransferase subunit C